MRGLLCLWPSVRVRARCTSSASRRPPQMQSKQVPAHGSGSQRARVPRGCLLPSRNECPAAATLATCHLRSWFLFPASSSMIQGPRAGRSAAPRIRSGQVRARGPGSRRSRAKAFAAVGGLIVYAAPCWRQSAHLGGHTSRSQRALLPEAVFCQAGTSALQLLLLRHAT